MLAFASAPACPVHALAACTHETGVVLAREEIVGDAEKAGAELTAAPRLIARLSSGTTIAGDG